MSRHRDKPQMSHLSVPERGRTLRPSQANNRSTSLASYPSMSYASYRFPSRDQSPHMSPDRITRHASPSRQALAKENEEIRPRIPQPYRTSFSAVTSPTRIRRLSTDAPNSGAATQLRRGNPVRATLPCRINLSSQNNAKSDDLARASHDKSLDQLHDQTHNSSATSQQVSYKVDGSHSPGAATAVAGLLQPARSGTTLTGSNSDVGASFNRLDCKYASTPAKFRTQSKQMVHGRTNANVCNPEIILPNGQPRFLDSVNLEDGRTVSIPSIDLDDCGLSSTGDLTCMTANANCNFLPAHTESLHKVDTVAQGFVLTKEYVHVQRVSYLKALEKDQRGELPPADAQTEKIARDMLKSRFWKSKPRSSSCGSGRKSGSVPASPEYTLKDKQGRSRTLPSESLLGSEKEEVAVKKSFSTSISNFLKRMSPRSLRKLSKGSERAGKPEDTTSNGSSTSLHTGSVDIDVDSGSHQQSSQSDAKTPTINKKSPKSPKKRLFSLGSNGKLKESATVKESKKTSEPCDASQDLTQPLPTSSSRMLKSLEDALHSLQKKDVYHAFKDKQSPKHAAEAMSMKPQALKAVEFPDHVLGDDDHQESQPVGSESSRSDDQTMAVVARAAAHPQFSPEIVLNSSANPDIKADAVSLSGQIDSPNRPEEPLRHRHKDPPKTLNVRDVSKLNKAAFCFPTLSMESIGQCSLDVTGTGSEPSIGSRNGQRSASATASKRTLVSQDGVSAVSPGGKSHGTIPSSLLAEPRNGSPATNPHSVPAAVHGTLSPVNGDDPAVPSTSPKTPSYLNIGRSIHGYRKYKGYDNSPKEQGQAKVVKKTELNGVEDSHVSAGLDSTLQNGYFEGHGCSALIRTDELMLANNTSDYSSDGSEHDRLLQTRNSTNTTGSDPINSTSPSSHISGATSRLEASKGKENVSPRTRSDSASPTTTTPPATGSHLNALHNRVGVASGCVDGSSGLPSATSATRNGGYDEQDSSSSITNGQRSDGVHKHVTSPNKDGKYFLTVVEVEEVKLRQCCSQMEALLQTERDIPEDASGKVRAAIGKATLLTSKKFKQFKGLCEQNMNQEGEEPFQTTAQDLAGFWDMVLLQVQDVNLLFEDVHHMKRNGWKSPVKEKKTPIGAMPKTPSSKSSGSKVKNKGQDTSATPRSGTPRSATPRSAKAQEAARAREAARKQLIAAKRAGRQRKASERDSDNDMVEIYVS